MPFLRGEFGQDQREDSKESPRMTAKLAIQVPSLPTFYLVQISQGLPPRTRREFHELYMPMSQVFEKLKAKGLLKP